MAKKRSNGKSKSKRTTLKKLKAADVETVPFQPQMTGIIELKEENPFADKNLGFNTKFDDSFIRLEKLNLKPAPYAPWYARFWNFLKSLFS